MKLTGYDDPLSDLGRALEWAVLKPCQPQGRKYQQQVTLPTLVAQRLSDKHAFLVDHDWCVRGQQKQL
jgi:hypothetical protein